MGGLWHCFTNGRARQLGGTWTQLGFGDHHQAPKPQPRCSRVQWTCSASRAAQPRQKAREMRRAAASYAESWSIYHASNTIWVCLKMVSIPKPNGFADHYPILSLWKMAIILGILTQHFQTNPYHDRFSLGEGCHQASSQKSVCRWLPLLLCIPVFFTGHVMVSMLADSAGVAFYENIQARGVSSMQANVAKTTSSWFVQFVQKFLSLNSLVKRCH